MNSLLINWKTTLSGAVTMISAALVTIPSVAPYATVIGLVASGLTGFLAKDKSVTGGTISAVDGKQLLEPVSMVDEKLK